MGKNKNKIIPKNKDFIDNATLNSWTYDDYMQRLKRLATSMFEWVNLPETMDARVIEETLYLKGECAFLYDDEWLWINTSCSSNGEINIYYLPNKLNCYSVGFNTSRIVYNGLVEPDYKNACIHVLCNYNRIPTISSMQLFAYRLYECQRSIDTNIQAQKFPYIALADDKTKLSIENMFSQINGNKALIVLDKNSGIDNAFKIFNTNIPFVADKLTKEKKEIWNEVLTFLGINNIDIDKKSRLIADEGESNNECINLNLQAFLVPRQEACKRLNKLMGLDGDKQVSVRVRSDLHNIIKEVTSSVSDLKINNTEEGEEVE